MRKARLHEGRAGFVTARRAFLRGSGLLGGAALVSGTTLAALQAWADGGRNDRGRRARNGGRSDYGELLRMPDQEGRTVLALPRDFQYVTFSRTGETMDDGFIVPRSHDGMGVFAGDGGMVRLIRNHELRTGPGAVADPKTFSLAGPAETRYDPQGVGGTVTLDFDLARRRLVRHFVSLNGTIVNCSGGIAWRDAGWLTCEETTAGPSKGWGRKHGYVFLVPAQANRPAPAVPLPWMGRFEHEAAVADARGVIYLTEDARGTSGFYRAIPANPQSLTQGGTLEMLAIKGKPGARLAKGQKTGAPLPVAWVRIDDPDPNLESDAPRCFTQGRSKGGAIFERLEGVFLGEDRRSAYFVSTSGGDKGYGQIWRFAPADEKRAEDTLELVFESPGGAVLDSPDNLCVTPSGALLLCEDDADPLGVDDHDTHPLAPGIKNVNRLIGLGSTGTPFTFAVNVLNGSEFAGACFSPDGEVLFVNIFGWGSAGTGMTCAIWGPWERGPL